MYEEITATHGIEGRLPTHALCPSPDVQLELGLLLSRIRHASATALDIEANAISILDRLCAASGASRELSKPSQLRSAARERAQRTTDAAKSFLDSNLAESIGVGDVAAEVGASPFHLCRLFKSVNGITLHEYRIRQRLAHVVHKLVDRRRSSLTELALDAGFSSHSHLTRMFRNRLGMAPSAARSLAETRGVSAETPDFR